MHMRSATVEMDPERARQALDAVIDHARGQAYKAIHVAEILHRDRTEHGQFDLAVHESYRTRSKTWRDEVCERLVGATSRSNGAWQDSLFAQAPTPETLTVLGRENRRLGGAVEAHVYRRLREVIAPVGDLAADCERTAPAEFSLLSMLDRCRMTPALQRIMARVFEISAWAVIDALVEATGVEITVAARSKRLGSLRLGALFEHWVLGRHGAERLVATPGAVQRLGVCCAGDGRVDLVSNFGFLAQVKHDRLDRALLLRIARQTPIEDATVICRDIARSYDATRLGADLRAASIRAVITERELTVWADQLASGQLGERAAQGLIRRLCEGLRREFPGVRGAALSQFIAERGYDAVPAWA